MKYPHAEQSTIAAACGRGFRENHSQFSMAVSEQSGQVRRHFSSQCTHGTNAAQEFGAFSVKLVPQDT